MKRINQYELFQLMLREMGETGWWPADSKIEIIIGAILIQNTHWINADRALTQLKAATQLNPETLIDMPIGELQELIRPAGFFKNKSQSIQEVLAWFESYGHDYKLIQDEYQADLRKQLLTLRGVGEETADVFLVYIFDQVAFIADKYAQKLYRHLGVEDVDNYKMMKQKVILDNRFTSWEAQEFHGLIDEFGKLYLRGEGSLTGSFLAGYQLDVKSL